MLSDLLMTDTIRRCSRSRTDPDHVRKRGLFHVEYVRREKVMPSSNVSPLSVDCQMMFMSGGASSPGGRSPQVPCVMTITSPNGEISTFGGSMLP